MSQDDFEPTLRTYKFAFAGDTHRDVELRRVFDTGVVARCRVEPCPVRAELPVHVSISTGLAHRQELN